MGTVLQAGQGQIPSRQAQIEAGIPIEVTSETINKVCASSVRAVGMIDQAVRAGDLEVAVGGGMESMSQAPYLLPGARSGFRMGDTKALDAMIQDGLRNPFSGKQMFEEATTVGDELEMTRADLDKWALRSHERALAATDDGRLADEIIPVTITSRKGDTVVEVDEAPRRGSSLEALAKLPGLTGKDGSHTAGNSPGVNDGAGALVLASEDWAERNGKDILAHDHRPGRGGRRVRLPRPHARQRGDQGARQGRPAAERHRPVGDQRGVLLRRAQQRPHARRRRGARERQRRRGRARPSDRGQSAPASSARSCSSCAGAAAATAARRSAPAAARATPIIVQV